MTAYVHPMHFSVNRDCASHSLDFERGGVDNVHTMHKKHYLREWRDHRGYTLEQVADRLEALAQQSQYLTPNGKKPIGTTSQNLGKVERGRVPYSQTLLEMLAEIYQTDPGSLLMRNPAADQAIYSIWDNIPPMQRETALIMLRGLAADRTGTAG